MKWAYILGAIVVASILFGVSWFVKAGDRTIARCIDCGLHRTTQTKLGLTSHQDAPNARTDWVARRVREPHDHHWSRSSTSEHINLWGATIAWRISELLLPVAGPEVVPALERLEPLGLDLLYNAELVHPNTERRALAIGAARTYAPGQSDEQMRTWWKSIHDSLNAVRPQ